MSAITTTAGSFTGTSNNPYIKYSNPYLDIASTYHPQSARELFSTAKRFFYGHSIVSAIIRKFSQYAITDIMFSDKNQKLCKTWKRILEDNLKIKSYSIHAGLNNFAMGNHLMSVRFPTRRKFICSSCFNETWEDQASYWDFKYPNFYCFCDKCDTRHVHTAVDMAVNDRERVSLLSWDVEDVFISFSKEMPEKTRYFYRVPDSYRSKINQGYKHQIAGIPVIYIEAMKKHRFVVIDNDNMYHMKTMGLSDGDEAWGKPVPMAVYKKIHYATILNKSQEAIAVDRANPLDIFYPQATSTFNPIKQIGLKSWRSDVAEQLKRHRNDINHKAIMSSPLGVQRVGGDAKALLLTPEIDQAQKEIAGGMGAPIEFVFGGLNWSGSSVSLRMLENAFLNWRDQVIDMIRWVMDRLSPYLGIPVVEVKFSDFKMADDPQQKQIAIQLYGMGMLSAKALLHQWGWNWETEMKQRALEEEARSKYKEKAMEVEAKISGRQMVLGAKYQGSAQHAMQVQIENSTKDAIYNKAKTSLEYAMRRQGNRDPNVDDMVSSVIRTIRRSGQEIGMQMLEILRDRSPNLVRLIELRMDEISGGMQPGMTPGAMGVDPGVMQSQAQNGMPISAQEQQVGMPQQQGIDMSPLPEQRQATRQGMNA